MTPDQQNTAGRLVEEIATEIADYAVGERNNQDMYVRVSEFATGLITRHLAIPPLATRSTSPGRWMFVPDGWQVVLNYDMERLAETAKMLARYGDDCFPPPNEKGQKYFGACLLDATEKQIIGMIFPLRELCNHEWDEQAGCCRACGAYCEEKSMLAASPSPPEVREVTMLIAQAILFWNVDSTDHEWLARHRQEAWDRSTDEMREPALIQARAVRRLLAPSDQDVTGE